MNKKYLWNVLTIMTALFTCISLSSCGDDGSNETGSDSGGNGNNNFAELIIGSWKQNYSDGYEMYTFRRNGSLSYVEYDNKEGEYVQNGTYSFDTNKMSLTMKAESGKSDVLQVIRLTANELELEELGVYVRVDGASEEDDPTDNPTESSSSDKRGAVAKTFRGAGTQENPYIISDASELRKLADDVASGMTYRDEYFKMTADITINRNVLLNDTTLNESQASTFEQWIPIGTKDTPFCGTFNGNGHTISGLYIDKENGQYLGLFGHGAGTFKNLKIKDSFIKGSKYAGGLLGYADKHLGYLPSLENIISKSIVCGKDYIGGILGYTKCAFQIKRCVNYGRIKGNGSGILGYEQNTGSGVTIVDCINYGDIGQGNGAGISRQLVCPTKIFNCANYGQVNGMGGITNGSFSSISGTGAYKIEINNCVNYGTVYSSHYKNGAILGLYNIVYILANLFYLETTNQYAFSTTVEDNKKNIRCMTAKQMKEQAFLDELNKNAKALGSSYSLWKFGKDGFPTLEWIEE